MPASIRLSNSDLQSLRCPICHESLTSAVDGELRCTNESCRSSFPIVDGIPIVINGAASIFSVEDFILRRTTTLAKGRPTALKRLLKALMGEAGFDSFKRRVRAMLPGIDKNLGSRKNYARLSELLSARGAAPRVLILGGGILGDGIDALTHTAGIQMVESDVSFGPRTRIILDAHDIPFVDQTFDAVIAQAVLEHVADPYRCVDEIYRVLKTDGLIYAETPFIQQVHAGRYDFTRFTHLGHRRLFRRFDEIDSGIVCGPGMALAWSYQYFLTSLVTSHGMRSAARLFARFTSFFLKYFDPLLAKKGGAFDAASGFYLLGSKSERTLSDRELITLYRGLDSL